MIQSGWWTSAGFLWLPAGGRTALHSLHRAWPIQPPKRNKRFPLTTVVWPNRPDGYSPKAVDGVIAHTQKAYIISNKKIFIRESIALCHWRIYIIPYHCLVSLLLDLDHIIVSMSSSRMSALYLGTPPSLIVYPPKTNILPSSVRSIVCPCLPLGAMPATLGFIQAAVSVIWRSVKSKKVVVTERFEWWEQ